MEVDELTASLGRWVRRLKCASSTIEANVQDALKRSLSEAEFVDQAEGAIRALIPRKRHVIRRGKPLR